MSNNSIKVSSYNRAKQKNFKVRGLTRLPQQVARVQATVKTRRVINPLITVEENWQQFLAEKKQELLGKIPKVIRL